MQAVSQQTYNVRETKERARERAGQRSGVQSPKQSIKGNQTQLGISTQNALPWPPLLPTS